MEVHIVHATCGSYSDRCEWLVAAYANGDAATEHARRAQEYDDEAQRRLRDYWDDDDADDDGETSSPSKYPRNPWDPRSPQYDETTYTVQILEIKQGAAMPVTLVEAVCSAKVD